MLNQDPIYKKLIIRRDILRIIYTLRMYRQLKHSTENKTIDTIAMERYIKAYGDLLPKIDKIIDATQKGLVNLNALGEYDDNLGVEVEKLFDKSTRTEKEKIMQIEDEIMYIRPCCPMQNTFITELMVACHELRLPEEYTKRVSKLLKLLPYDPLSSEREYIITSATNFTWFKNYLFRSDIPIEEHQKNYDEFILTFIGYPRVNEIELLKSVIDLYKKTTITPSINTIQTLIDKLTLDPFKSAGARDVLFLIRDSKLQISNDLETYFNSTLSKLENRDPEYFKLAEALVKIFDSMISVFDYEDCLKILIKKCTSEELYSQILEQLIKKYKKNIIVKTFQSIYNQTEKNSIQKMILKKDS